MKYITIIKGDFEHTAWMLEEDKLTIGTYNVQDIPIREIIAIKKNEIIKKDYYIEFELGSGQSFTAKMKEKTYNHVYKAFISRGNHPTNIQLPIKVKSKTNIIWGGGGLILLILFVSLGNSKGDNKSQSANVFDKATATAICDINIENVAIYGSEKGAFRDVKFYKHDNGSGYRLVRSFKLGNAYGGFAKSQASCRFNKNGTLTGLNINGEKVI